MISDYEWMEKRMKHPCPFCGNAYTFMSVQMEMNIEEKTYEGHTVHSVLANVICHKCGATVEGRCHIREMAVE